jgi:hypothetical protein
VAAVVGIILLSWAFVAGTSVALSGSGSGAFAYEILFIAAGVLVLGALAWAIVNLVQRQARVLSVITIVVSQFPLFAIIGLAVAAG